MAWLYRCKVALLAFEWFFSRVSSQMTPQMAWLSGCMVTLVAFVLFFSRVGLQMSPQIACPSRCIVALVAFVRFFSRVSFDVSPQTACMKRCEITFIASVCLLAPFLCHRTGRFRQRHFPLGDKSRTDNSIFPLVSPSSLMIQTFTFINLISIML